MKTSFKYLAPCLLFAALPACQEEEVPLYIEETGKINFSLTTATADSITNYTFVYEPQTKQEDTLWLELFTTGFITDYPRPVALRQLPVDTLQARPGVHYVALDDPRVAASYVIPAGESRARIPIILKRDTSLAETTYSLTLGLDENEHFKPGFVENRKMQITISDILVKPAIWASIWDMIFATYGPVTHRFMIDNAPEGITPDETFINSIFTLSDSGIYMYWKRYFQIKLAEENERRATQGLGPLREAPTAGQSEGQLITF
jgi:hypothetical protein